MEELFLRCKKKGHDDMCSYLNLLKLLSSCVLIQKTYARLPRHTIET
jgi:hypothetical protein